MRVDLGSKTNKEGIAMMLRSHIESGQASPYARPALSKIQRSPGGEDVKLSRSEVNAVLNVYGDVASDYYWTPMGETDYDPKYPHIGGFRSRRGSPRYLTERELQALEEEEEDW